MVGKTEKEKEKPEKHIATKSESPIRTLKIHKQNSAGNGATNEPNLTNQRGNFTKEAETPQPDEEFEEIVLGAPSLIDSAKREVRKFNQCSLNKTCQVIKSCKLQKA